MTRFVSLVVVFLGMLHGNGIATTAPIERDPASADAAASLPEPISLAAALGDRTAGAGSDKLVLIALLPAGTDPSVQAAFARVFDVKRPELIVISADEGKAAESELFSQVVRTLRITDFPCAVVCTTQGVPLLGVMIGFESSDQLGAAMDGWIRDARRIMDLTAIFPGTGAAQQPGIMAELLKLQGGAFATTCRPGLQAFLESDRWRQDPVLRELIAGAEEAAAKRVFQQVFDEIMPVIAEATGEGQLDKIIAILDEAGSRPGLSPFVRQRLEMQGFRHCVNARNFERALQFLDRAEKSAPNSQIASRIPKFRAQIKSALAKPEAGSAPAAGTAGDAPSQPPPVPSPSGPRPQ